MFYCEKCQKKNDWPVAMMRSRGRCEVCGDAAVCYDVHHSQLPLRGAAAVEERLADHDFTAEPIDDAFCNKVHPLARNYLNDKEMKELGDEGTRAVLKVFLRWALKNIK